MIITLTIVHWVTTGKLVLRDAMKLSMGKQFYMLMGPSELGLKTKFSKGSLTACRLSTNGTAAKKVSSYFYKSK